MFSEQSEPASPKSGEVGENPILMTETKQLLLLRHAKSSWDDPSLADEDRPLAPRGRKAARRIRAYVRRERIPVGLALVLLGYGVRT